jgi:hypothetical protein
MFSDVLARLSEAARAVPETESSITDKEQERAAQAVELVGLLAKRRHHHGLGKNRNSNQQLLGTCRDIVLNAQEEGLQRLVSQKQNIEGTQIVVLGWQWDETTQRGRVALLDPKFRDPCGHGQVPTATCKAHIMVHHGDLGWKVVTDDRVVESGRFPIVADPCILDEIKAEFLLCGIDRTLPRPLALSQFSPHFLDLAHIVVIMLARDNAESNRKATRHIFAQMNKYDSVLGAEHRCGAHQANRAGLSGLNCNVICAFCFAAGVLRPDVAFDASSMKLRPVLTAAGQTK